MRNRYLFVFFLALFSTALNPSFSWAEEADGKDLTIEDFLQKLSTIPDVVTRKDPFVKVIAPFDSLKKLDDGTISESAPILERYPLNQYTVVATLLGDQYPRALLRLPSAEKGKVLIVKVKDKIGNRGGVITKILKDGIVVVQSIRSQLGFVDKSEIILRVGGDGLDITGASPKTTPAEPQSVPQGMQGLPGAPVMPGMQP